MTGLGATDVDDNTAPESAIRNRGAALRVVPDDALDPVVSIRARKEQLCARVGLFGVEQPEVAARILQSEGFRVGVCSSAFGQSRGEFSHVVDGVRHVEHGLEAIAELRTSRFYGSIIIVSFHIRLGQEVVALRAGASECLRAPPDWAAVAARFRHEDVLRASAIPAVASDRSRLSAMIRGAAMSPQDRRILRVLAEANGQPVGWLDLLDDGVLASDHSRHALETAVSALRKKVGKHGIRIVKSAAGWWLLF